MILHFVKTHSYKLALFWAAVIFGLCSVPGSLIPSVSWLELLSFDKWVHAGVFFILVSFFGIAVKANQQNERLTFFWFILSVLYGGALEIMQATLFSGRSADWMDMIANSFGCVIALVTGKRIRLLIFK